MAKSNKDWKIVTIAVMTLLLVGVGSWIGYTFYQSKQQNFAFQNQQLGRVIGQQDVVRSVQSTGYFAFNVPTQEGGEQQVLLVGQLATPDQIQQAQQTQPAQEGQIVKG